MLSKWCKRSFMSDKKDLERFSDDIQAVVLYLCPTVPIKTNKTLKKQGRPICFLAVLKTVSFAA